MAFKAKLTALTLGAVLATTAATAALGQGMGPGPIGGKMADATFAKIDTNGDKVLSQDEIRAYVAGQIKGLDANGDGVLTADEMSAKMTEMRKERVTAWATSFLDRIGKDGKVSVEDMAKRPIPMDRMLQRMLAAGEGKISKATFEAVEAMGGFAPGHRFGQHAGMPGDRKGRGHEGWGRRGEMRDHGPGGWMGRQDRGGAMFDPGMMPKFSDIDTNGDGSITADEIAAYKLARVKAIDSNGDGFITADEFATYVVGRMQPRIKAQSDALFAKLDLNNDGKVTIEELAAAPMDMMFARLPTDKDGNVSEKAFQQAMSWKARWHHEGIGRHGRDHGRDGGRDGAGWHHHGAGMDGHGWQEGMMPPSSAPDEAPSGN